MGHDLVHHDAQAATCTEVGWNEYDTCSRCDYSTYAEIPALGHDLVHHEAKAATCVEIGWGEYDTCSRCDYSTYAEIPALGHTPGEAVHENEVAATYEAEGSYDEVIYCTVCGEELSRTRKTSDKLEAPLAITAQPANMTAAAGTTATFKVTATGATSYQWQASTDGGATWVNSGANGNKTATLSFTAAAAHTGYQFRCVVKSSSGQSVTSTPATLTIGSVGVTITAQPANVTVTAGSTATFKVTASGATSYQWQVSTDGGATWVNSGANGNKTATLSFTAAAAHKGYMFRCVVKSGSGQSVTSNHPATKEVVEHHVAVYAARKEDRIIRAPHPAELLAHSVATPSLVVAIMNAKYTNALPLYRIAQEMERYDVRIPVPTMANWVIRCAERYLYPVTDRMYEALRLLPVVQADETVCKVSKDGRPANAESRMFVYRSGEFETGKTIVLYDYQKTRKAEHIADFLGEFSGILVSDAYGGYHSLDQQRESIHVANCWAHARRPFADAVKLLQKKGGPSKQAVKKSIAYQALDRIASLFALESDWKDLTPEERHCRRQEHSKPLVEAYFAWVNPLTRILWSLRIPKRVYSTASIRKSNLRSFSVTVLFPSTIPPASERFARSASGAPTGI